MLSILIRQRRRVIFFAACLLVAGLIRLGLSPFVVLILAPAIGLPAFLLSRAPDLRRTIEAIGLGTLLMAAMPTPLLSLVPTIPAASYLAYQMLYGRWTDRMPLRISLVSSVGAKVPAPVESVWDQLIPGEAEPEQHWSGTLVDVMADHDDPMTLHLRRRRSSGLTEEMTLTFIDYVADRSCRYVLERKTDGIIDESIHTFSVDPTGDEETVVESVMAQHAMLPRVALGRFLDDTMGDEWDGPGIKSKRTRTWHFHNRETSPLPALPYPA